MPSVAQGHPESLTEGTSPQSSIMCPEAAVSAEGRTLWVCLSSASRCATGKTESPTWTMT